MWNHRKNEWCFCRPGFFFFSFSSAVGSKNSIISLNFPSHELYFIPVNLSCLCSKVMIRPQLIFFVYPQEWVALENLEVDGSPGMTSIPVSVFKVSPLNLFQWPCCYCTFLVSSWPSQTTTLVPFTNETFLKGTQACNKPLLEPKCLGVGLERFFMMGELDRSTLFCNLSLIYWSFSYMPLSLAVVFLRV